MAAFESYNEISVIWHELHGFLILRINKANLGSESHLGLVTLLWYHQNTFVIMLVELK